MRALLKDSKDIWVEIFDDPTCEQYVRFCIDNFNRRIDEHIDVVKILSDDEIPQVTLTEPKTFKYSEEFMKRLGLINDAWKKEMDLQRSKLKLR